MLTQLNISNFAIIDDASLELAPGMTVLSGETGAGKSILIDALGLLLGDRADSDSVRGDEDRAEINAEFHLGDAGPGLAWLAERELDDGDTCLLRRVVLSDGGSRAWINGSPSNLRDLKALGECLVDIYGQHAHQSLLRREAQRELLDAAGDHEAQCKKVAELTRQYRQISERMASLQVPGEGGELRADFLRHQVQELDALNLKQGELDELDAEHKRLANAGRLIEEIQQALTLLYEGEDGTAHDQLSQAQGLLEALAKLDQDLKAPAELAASARIQAQEAADQLRSHLDRLDLDPERLDSVERRLGEIQDLARKHHVRPEELPAQLERLDTELADIEQADARLEELQRELAETEAAYRKAAAELNKQRHKTAKRLTAKVTEVLRTLGMPQGEFEIVVEAEPEAPVRATGTDRIAFLVTANPGQPAAALAKVASGGELSRIALAIQVVAAQANQTPTLIFDEVDAGIGGGVAEIVGRRLRQLGEHRQVLCVTHLPQVAAQATHHVQVDKEIAGNQTYTRLKPLGQKERVEEIARMLGGVQITESTRAHAAEMMGLKKAG